MIKQKLIEYLKSLGYENVIDIEYEEIANGIIEWQLERMCTKEAISTAMMYGYTKSQAKKLIDIVCKR